jgi:hypothetical protein
MIGERTPPCGADASQEAPRECPAPDLKVSLQCAASQIDRQVLLVQERRELPRNGHPLD